MTDLAPTPSADVSSLIESAADAIVGALACQAGMLFDERNARIAARAAIAAYNTEAAIVLKRYREALEEIALYGCGMLNQPATLNGREAAWLSKRIAEYERVAHAALKAGA